MSVCPSAAMRTPGQALTAAAILASVARPAASSWALPRSNVIGLAAASLAKSSLQAARSGDGEAASGCGTTSAAARAGADSTGVGGAVGAAAAGGVAGAGADSKAGGNVDAATFACGSCAGADAAGGATSLLVSAV